ncbi:MAG: hypothetical protein ACYC62_04745, partial [Coriobacteriia bacterium]
MAERQVDLIESSTGHQRDPVAHALLLAILGVIVVALFGLAYLLLAGVVNPQTPRTALEAQLAAVREATITNPSSGEVWADYVTALVAVEDYGEAGRVLDESMSALEGDGLLLVQISGVELLLAEEKYDDALELAEAAVVLEKEQRDKAMRDAMERGIHADPKLYAPDIATDV